MANSYSAPNFSFDTTTLTGVADMTALKGGAPAATDYLYISEAATVTLESNVTLAGRYLGDNPSGTAAVKTGHIRKGAGLQITWGTNTVHEGFSGEGTTSTNLIPATTTVTCTNADKVTNYNSRACVFTSHGTLQKIYGIYAGAAHDVLATLFDDCFYAYIFDAANHVLPASLAGVEFRGCQASIRDTTTTEPPNWLDTMGEVKYTGNASGNSAMYYGYGTTSGISRYVKIRFNAASIIAAPSWTTTTGIQTLVDNLDGTLTATWGAATHGTSDQTNYRIYIRAGSAPDSFGKGSTYFLGETADTTFTIATTATGARLANATAYYVIVKAATDSSAEDANTTSLNVTTATVTLANIFSILQVVMVNTLG